MRRSARHARHQLPTLASIGRIIWRAKRPSFLAPTRSTEAPGPWLEAHLEPRPADLVEDYIRHVGADPADYAGTIPPHLFSQWAFPILSEAIAQLPHDFTRVVNAGCRLEMRGPLPVAEPLMVRARLDSVDDDGRRAIVVERLETGPPAQPDALVAEQVLIVPPLKRRKGGSRGAPRETPGVDADLELIGSIQAGADAGLEFALLTGDVNPAHWLPAFARMLGHPRPIIHGFSSMARAYECVRAAYFGGDPHALRNVDVRFTRPLALPARAHVFASRDGRLAVGHVPGGVAYLVGTYSA